MDSSVSPKDEIWFLRVSSHFNWPLHTYTHTIHADQVEGTVSCMHNARLQLKCDGTQWRTGGEVKGKTGELSGQPVPFTQPRNMVYPALLPLMRTPRLPVVDQTDAPADLNELVRFAERWNLVSARVPSHFNWPLHVLPSYPSKIQFSIIFKRGSTPGQGQEIILYSKAHSPVLGHITPLTEWVPGFVLRDTAAKARDWPTPPARAEIKNLCSCISTRPHAFIVSRPTNFIFITFICVRLRKILKSVY